MAKRILIYTNHFYPEQFKINEIVDWLTSEDSHIRVITGLPNYPSGKIIKEYSDTFSKNILINRLFLVPRGGGSNFLLVINYLSYFISCFIFTIYIAIFKKNDIILFIILVHRLLCSTQYYIPSFTNQQKYFGICIWPEFKSN